MAINVSFHWGLLIAKSLSIWKSTLVGSLILKYFFSHLNFLDVGLRKYIVLGTIVTIYVLYNGMPNLPKFWVFFQYVKYKIVTYSLIQSSMLEIL